MTAPLYFMAAALWAIAAAFTGHLFVLNCVSLFLSTFLAGLGTGVFFREINQ